MCLEKEGPKGEKDTMHLLEGALLRAGQLSRMGANGVLDQGDDQSLPVSALNAACLSLQ